MTPSIITSDKISDCMVMLIIVYNYSLDEAHSIVRLHDSCIITLAIDV